jgi:DNA gyrase subunit A
MGKKKEHRLWEDNISDDKFENEKNIDEIELAEYDLEKMTTFSANINYFRQIIRLSDSLKPVERRILYTMYEGGLKPTSKTKKSQMIIGDASKLHAHLEPYGSLVNMAQPWKRQCPLVAGKGNFGTDQYPEIYAAMRYTEATISKYAYECFFEDFDADCVETIFNSASDGPEPMSLPSKFPNILVNGSIGIAIGNSFCIPSYNIDDIVDNCKKVLENPMTTEVFMIPDIPTGCDIIDDGHSFADIIETGTGTLKMRSTIEIIEGKKTWTLKVCNLPWLVSLSSVEARLVEASKAGKIAIKDLQNACYPIRMPDGSHRTKIDYRIIIDKSYDPNQVKTKIYKLTQLEKDIPINFKVVLEELAVKRLNMKDLILAWIDERRSYKRRLYNKKLTKISARIDLLKIMIYLLKAENIEKTIKIIKESDSSELVDKLMKHGKMNSYQANKIANMRLGAFTKDARIKYKEEKEELENQKEELIKLIGSEKKIDKIIGEELEELRKYGHERYCNIISESTGLYISNFDYNIILTKQNYIKKILVDTSTNAINMGTFKNLDVPINLIKINNLKNIIFIDSYGYYTSMPVNEIYTTGASNIGLRAYDVCKLNGNIISMAEQLEPTDIETLTEMYGKPYIVTLSANGLLKKTPLMDIYREKGVKNRRLAKLRENDYIVYADIILENNNKLLIYTKLGRYIMVNIADINETSIQSSGVIVMKPDGEDECAGIAIISSADEYITILTEHGNIKKTETKYLGEIPKRGSDGSSYLTALDKNDKVINVNGVRDDNESLVAITRTDYHVIPIDEIPTLTRKAKCRKFISQNEGGIVKVDIVSPKE